MRQNGFKNQINAYRIISLQSSCTVNRLKPEMSQVRVIIQLNLFK